MFATYLVQQPKTGKNDCQNHLNLFALVFHDIQKINVIK